jgi:radical SAM protein with 4Fe4S-binding SPASM domain
MRISTAAQLAGTALRRSLAESVFLRSGVDLTKPSDIRATLTERCNYQCLYCDHWRQDRYTDEMSLAEWQKALLSVRDFVPHPTVQFLGGEPTIVPWFFDLIRFCAEHHIGWGVVTNGSTLSGSRVRQIVAAKPLNIDISLDSRKADLHDLVRGVRGSMNHVSDGIERLVHERRRSGWPFAIRIKATITRQTMGTLAGIVDWAETMPGVLVDFSPVRLWREGEIEAMYPRGEEEMQTLASAIDALIARKRGGGPIETSIAKLRAITEHFSFQKNRHGVSLCRVGLRSINIRPNGDVGHCWNFNHIGNLRSASMADIWNGEIRRATVQETVGCSLFDTTCSTSCHAHRTLLQEAARGVRLLAQRTG